MEKNKDNIEIKEDASTFNILDKSTFMRFMLRFAIYTYILFAFHAIRTKKIGMNFTK